jgi:hypothetical protein
MEKEKEDPKKQLSTAIRDWIHMDNVAEVHAKQAANARELRAKHEATAIQLIKQMNLTKSTIKVSGASLQLASRKANAALTWTFLEREVAAWAASQSPSPSPSAAAKQAQSLMTWLQGHRDVREAEYIKKTTAS